VHVHEVQLDRAKQFLYRARHVDRERRRASPRSAGKIEHLAHRDHPRDAVVGALEQGRGPALARARRA